VVKQKNLILLVVAVGCGLLAAFLTTQMKAGPASVEMQEIYVAAKELNVGQKIDKDKFAELIKKKKVPKADVPINAILSEEELLGKDINRQLRTDDFIAVGDVGQFKVVAPPPGKHLYTIKLSYEAFAGPFVQPGAQVDVVCTHRPPGSNEIRHINLLPEILIMAVDLKNQKSGEPGQQTVNTITLAASLNESKWLQLAQDAGAQLRFIVRGEGSETFTKLPDDELIALFNKPVVDPKDVAKAEAKKPVETETPERPLAPPIRIPVAIGEIKAGTEITDEFIEKAMRSSPFAAPAPADAILDLTAYKGRKIISDLPQKSYLTVAVLSEATKTIETPKPVDAPKPAETPKTEAKKIAKTWETTITTGTGTKKYRYLMYEGETEWTFAGEVHEDGSTTNGPMPSIQPKPDAAKGGVNDGGKISQP
jgi:Flp pilus assembly protein CpaB